MISQQNNSFGQNMLSEYDYGVNKKMITPGERQSLSGNNTIGDSEKQFMKYLVEMHTVLNGSKIDLHRFKNVVEAIQGIKQDQENAYYKTLARPESTRGSKIPSQIPIPSSSFQLKQSLSIKTNTIGNAALLINPFFLSTNTSSSTVYANVSDTMGGNASDNFWDPINAGQAIPNVYQQYRLVSASVVAKYVGRLDTVQGLIGGAIVFDDNVNKSVIGSGTNPNLAKYGDFNLAQDAYFHQENYALNGIRELYIPLDVSYEQYQKTNVEKNGYAMMIYMLGCTPSSAPFKIDLTFNFECLPDVTFLNYIPTSLGSNNTKGKDEAVKKVQAQPISPESINGTPVVTPTQNTPKEENGGGGGFLDTVGDIIGTIGKYLPSVLEIGSMLF